MQYAITFLEGIISFISPCMLPMLPVYITYFAGDSGQKQRALFRAFGFVLGFTAVFTAMGLFAGTLSRLLTEYSRWVNRTCGLVVMYLGLQYLTGGRSSFFKGMRGDRKINGFFSAVLFGMVYSISLTPCVGIFLGSALMLASTSGSSLKGAALLLVYSLGLGIPFLISALLIERLNFAFSFIKKHYEQINFACGTFLIFISVMMGLGLMNAVMTIFW